MGITVANKVVSYDANHQKLVNTSVDSNPTKEIVKGLVIHSVFKRVREKSTSSDGNPLMYALKRTRNYTIAKREIVKFLPNFYHILATLQNEYCDLVIVPMPSSHKIAWMLANRVQRIVSGSVVVTNVFQKKKCSQVYEELQRITPSKKHESEFKQLLAALKKTPTLDFSLKEVKVDLRKFTIPLLLSVSSLPKHTTILLVDDLMATGQTLLSARDLLSECYPHSEIKGLCLLSSVG